MADEHNCEPSCALRRREFLGAAALAALALLETACGDGEIGPNGLDSSGVPSDGGTVVNGNTLIVTVSSYKSLGSTGGAARVDTGSGLPVALVRTGAATFTAYSLRCPHEGFTVNVLSTSFYCPAHGARFSGSGVNNGGQRTGNLTTLGVSYDATAGTVTITR